MTYTVQLRDGEHEEVVYRAVVEDDSAVQDLFNSFIYLQERAEWSDLEFVFRGTGDSDGN